MYKKKKMLKKVLTNVKKRVLANAIHITDYNFFNV